MCLTMHLSVSPGAPVKQALIDAGIGDDVYGLHTMSGILQPVFSFVAKKCPIASQADEFEKHYREHS